MFNDVTIFHIKAGEGQADHKKEEGTDSKLNLQTAKI
jgi:hypothetical protein